jgi:hypothetical protein
MSEHMRTIRYLLVSFVILSAFAAGELVKPVSAQEADAKTPARKYEGRDPFKKYEPPKIVISKKAGQVTPPSIQERIASYRAQKLAAMNARMPVPKPTTALLLSEMQVVGISRSPRGYAAIVEATPIKLSYVIYPGERFYDGQLVAIEDSRLVFRRETIFTDGRRERSVEMKPLRQVNPVEALARPEAAMVSNAGKDGSAVAP